MVITRSGGSFAELQKKKSEEYFLKFARQDITLRSITRVANQKGRVDSVSVSTSTIIGDLQFDSKLLAQYVQLGLAVTGDAIFYTKHSYTINQNDEVVVGSTTWRLVEQVEAEETTGEIVYQGWVARRKP